MQKNFDRCYDVDYEFSNALINKNAYPVFQPIVDKSFRLHGFELLVRWCNNDKELLPSEFLPKVKSEKVWQQLTSCMFSEAVKKINQTNGKYAFAVNVPDVLVGNKNLINILLIAASKLEENSWKDRIVLEFPETTVFLKNSKIHSVKDALMEAGFSVLLDDCYSESSVFFPVRMSRFSGYKIDRSILTLKDETEHDLALLKTIIYYCQLTCSMCTAEGIDSYHKFCFFSNLGFNYFQGNWISPPIYERDFIKYIKQFG